MKKIISLLLVGVVPTFSPLMSCSLIKDLKVELNYDNDIFKSVEKSGDLKVNGEEWYINCEFINDQYTLSDVEINVGNKTLKHDSDFSFTSKKITIYAGVCNSQQVKVNLSADFKISELHVEWKNVSQYKIYNDYVLFQPGDKITTDNLHIQIEKADGSKVEATYGKGKDKYWVTIDATIPDNFETNGYTFSNSDFYGKKSVVSPGIGIHYSYGGIVKARETLSCLLGLAPTTTFKIKEQGDRKYKINDKYDLSYLIDAGDNGYKMAEFTMTDAGDTGSKFDEDKTTLITGNKAGTIKFKAKSILNNKETDEVTYTIDN